MRKPILLTIFFLFSMTLGTIKAEPTILTHWGVVGNLRYRIAAPNEVKVGENFTVTFLVNVHVIPSDLRIEYITAELEGAGVSWSDTLATNLNITSTQELQEWLANKTAVVKPTVDGAIVNCVMEFRFTDAYWDYNIRTHEEIDISYTRTKTYTELYSENEASLLNLSRSQLLMYGLAVTTIVLMSTTIYFARRKPEVKTD